MTDRTHCIPDLKVLAGCELARDLDRQRERFSAQALAGLVLDMLRPDELAALMALAEVKR
jgi:hypothetical protein